MHATQDKQSHEAMSSVKEIMAELKKVTQKYDQLLNVRATCLPSAVNSNAVLCVADLVAGKY